MINKDRSRWVLGDGRQGAALIQVLIGVALAGALLAAAAPNFQESRSRTSVSRARAEMRAIATALENYAADQGGYPFCNNFGPALASSFTMGQPILEVLTTPVAYLTGTAILRDPYPQEFRRSGATAAGLYQSSPVPISPADQQAAFYTYIYQSWNTMGRTSVPPDAFGVGGPATAWLLHSAGPDHTIHNLGGVLANDYNIDEPMNLMYDPTNGTVSFGCIYTTGGNAPSTGNYAAGEGLVKAIKAAQPVSPSGAGFAAH